MSVDKFSQIVQTYLAFIYFTTVVLVNSTDTRNLFTDPNSSAILPYGVS